MDQTYNGFSDSYVNYVRMRSGAFMKLAKYWECTMQPGPDSDEVLYDQSRHRSQKISFSERGPELVMFNHSLGHSRWTLDDERMIAIVAQAGIDNRAWRKVCDDLLGATPPSLTGGYMRLKWLKENFSHLLLADATQEVIERHTHAYILHMTGTILFPDSSKDKIHLRWLSIIEDLDICGTLSWGSAVLAYLY
ncbi:protein MAIN-LIKE 2-like [Asparagus officinalis]|uniref:protein MAIN-LIKE 2-like n=1 Tax=Asparagus officinalis TaxID=4686 RepID=UPI00098DF211|nr:protein MAIN-LIKE 2-like [Asparagus officinalis]